MCVCSACLPHQSKGEGVRTKGGADERAQAGAYVASSQQPNQLIYGTLVAR